MGIATTNPTTGEILKTFAPLNDEEIERKLSLAESTFKTYKQTSMSQRSIWLKKAGDILNSYQVQFAEIITQEMGKPIKSSIAEVTKCAKVCTYYADYGEKFLANETISTDASNSYISYQPLGIILAVMPWNFPFWQVLRFAAPALMAGNVGILKHASNVPQCALTIEEIFNEAGFPQGAFQTLLIGSDKIEKIIQDDRVKAATLTGSEAAGASLAAAAGKVIKKTVLELGGSDPFIVLNSANLEEAVATAVTARMLNNGQSCIAAKRFILHDEIADEFQQKLIEKLQNLKIGDPMSEDTNIGPLATVSMLEEIDQQVKKTVSMGGKLLTGGERIEGKGNFYLPTAITDIPKGSPGESEEFFGPVALIFRVKNIEEAIHLANNTCFGLGASGWTNNPEEQAKLINEIEAGAVFINGLVKSDQRLPFGGIKKSGYGRELGVFGIREFVNIKTVWVK